MEKDLTFKSALRHYSALLRYLNRLKALSFDLRYKPYLYERTDAGLHSRAQQILLKEGKNNFAKKMLEETKKIKSGMPVRVRFGWGPGTSPKEVAQKINEVLNTVKGILVDFADKIVLEVPGISVNDTPEILTSGKKDLSKGSLAFGVWKGRTLWYDEIVKVAFWVLRKTEAERLSKIASVLIPWANKVELPDCMVMGGPVENKKILITAPIVMRLHPGTDYGDLQVSLITWDELAECCSKVQQAVHILERCVLLGRDKEKTDLSIIARDNIDRTTPEPESEKGGWGRIKKIHLILGIIVSLIVIWGAYNKYIRKDKPAAEQSEIPKTENKITIEAETSGDNSPIVGGDYVAGNKTVNVVMSDSVLKAIVKQIANEQNDELAMKYPGGSAVFGVTQKGFIVPKGLVPPNSEIKWDTARVLELTENSIKILLPRMIINTETNKGLKIEGSEVELPKKVNAKWSLIKLPGLRIQVEIIGIDDQMVVVGIGFIPISS